LYTDFSLTVGRQDIHYLYTTNSWIAVLMKQNKKPRKSVYLNVYNTNLLFIT